MTSIGNHKGDGSDEDNNNTREREKKRINKKEKITSFVATRWDGIGCSKRRDCITTGVKKKDIHISISMRMSV